LAGKGKHDARQGCVVQVLKAEEFCSFELIEKEIISNYDETKSKDVKEKYNGSKKGAFRRQSV